MLHKISSPRHRTLQDDANDFVAICFKYMEHEKANILRRNLRNILGDYQHCLYVRYMRADIVDLLLPRHQTHSIIKRLIKVGQRLQHRWNAGASRRQQ